MKKSKAISLVLITSALASCHKSLPKVYDLNHNKVYMRSDTSAGYTRPRSSPWMWYYAFRPYGMIYGNSYHHAGYYSNSISESSNVGHSAMKGGIVRGGFGGSHSFSVSS